MRAPGDHRTIDPRTRLSARTARLGLLQLNMSQGAVSLPGTLRLAFPKRFRFRHRDSLNFSTAWAKPCVADFTAAEPKRRHRWVKRVIFCFPNKTERVIARGRWS